MFVLVPQNDPDTLKLVERVTSGFHDELDGQEVVLLTITEVEGAPVTNFVAVIGRALSKIEGVEAEAEMYAYEHVLKIKDKYPPERAFFCTVAEYLPHTRTYARAVTGVVLPRTCNIN